MKIYHERENHTFYTVVKNLKCVLDYELHGEDIEIYHTYVPESLRGQGIAAALTEEISKYALENNLKIIPTCSYAVSFYRRNFEKYKNILKEDSLQNDGSCRIK
ncbi:MAG: N-acetyltransferase [Brevinematales bacterium]|nr:N-acetyltransferase [Brevinematales bacterium]